jgi:protein-S-isoprenylcysteine O-methyltransferase Ste14
MMKLVDWAKAHPRLAAWIVLALGMNGLVAYEAREVGLLVGQWIALIVATTLVAGLCVWIIGWEDEPDQSAQDNPDPETNKK